MLELEFFCGWKNATVLGKYAANHMYIYWIDKKQKATGESDVLSSEKVLVERTIPSKIIS